MPPSRCCGFSIARYVAMWGRHDSGPLYRCQSFPGFRATLAQNFASLFVRISIEIFRLCVAVFLVFRDVLLCKILILFLHRFSIKYLGSASNFSLYSVLLLKKICRYFVVSVSLSCSLFHDIVMLLHKSDLLVRIFIIIVHEMKEYIKFLVLQTFLLPFFNAYNFWMRQNFNVLSVLLHQFQ